MNQKLDVILEQFVQTAKKNLLKDGYLAPYIFLIRGSREQPEIAATVEMRFKTEKKKDLIAGQIKKLITAKGAWGYIIVNEAWMFDPDDFPDGKIPTGIAPSQHPKHREGIWVALFTYDYHRGLAVIFERQEEKIVFTKDISMEPDMQSAGRFSQLLPPIN